MANSKKWYKVSLRILGDNLTPDEITKRLGMLPSASGIKGEYIGDKVGRSRYETNLWSVRLTKDDSIPFEEQLPSILDLLEMHKVSLESILKTGGMEGELFLGFGSDNGQGGIDFPHSVPMRIVRLGLSVLVDSFLKTSFPRALIGKKYITAPARSSAAKYRWERRIETAAGSGQRAEGGKDEERSTVRLFDGSTVELAPNGRSGK